jgi:hypothetical protein
MLKQYIKRNSGKMVPKLRWDEIPNTDVCNCQHCVENPEIINYPTAILVPEKIKIGVMIADKIELSDGTEEVRIGWSLCNKGSVSRIDRIKLFNTAIKLRDNNTSLDYVEELKNIEELKNNQVSKEDIEELMLYLVHSTQIYFYLKNPADEFNKIEALDFAYYRLLANKDVENYPPSIKKDLKKFINRCRQYFQDIPIINWADELH